MTAGTGQRGLIAGWKLDTAPDHKAVVRKGPMRHRIANPEADIPERRHTPADIVVGSPTVGVEQRQAVARRAVPVALGQVEHVMPGLDEPVERAGAVGEGGDLEQILPAIPEPVSQGKPLPVGLAVDQDPLRA